MGKKACTTKLKWLLYFPIILGLYRHIVGQEYQALHGKNHHLEDNHLTVQVCHILSRSLETILNFMGQ